MTGTLWTLFWFGLSGSWHCVLMCGPLCSASCKGKGAASFQFLGARLFAYVFLGFAAGLLGTFAFAWMRSELRTAVTFFAAVVLVVFAFSQVFQGKGFRKTASAQKINGSRTKDTSFLMRMLENSPLGRPTTSGLITGFLPCGFLGVALLQAATLANPLFSSLGMGLFALATSPSLWGGQAVLRRFSAKFGWNVRKLTTGLFVLSALLLAFRSTQDLFAKEGEGLPCHGAPAAAGVKTSNE